MHCPTGSVPLSHLKGLVQYPGNPTRGESLLCVACLAQEVLVWLWCLSWQRLVCGALKHSTHDAACAHDQSKKCAAPRCYRVRLSHQKYLQKPAVTD